MQDSSLTFRPAEAGDLNTIWSLLHADSKAWGEERINANLNRMYLLFRSGKLIGVLLADDAKYVDWLAVHPLYPENELSDLLLKCYDNLCVAQSREQHGLICRLNEAPV